MMDTTLCEALELTCRIINIIFNQAKLKNNHQHYFLICEGVLGNVLFWVFVKVFCFGDFVKCFGDFGRIFVKVVDLADYF